VCQQSQDLNARIGDQRIRKVIGTNGEPTVNTNGKKLTAFCCLNSFRIRNSFSKNRYPQIYMAPRWENKQNLKRLGNTLARKI